jgi:hypothetical protein
VLVAQGKDRRRATSTAEMRCMSPRLGCARPTTLRSLGTHVPTGRAMVTENVADFADEEGLVPVVVLKKYLPSGGAQAAALADVSDRWIEANPEPYVGHHWPK